MNSAVVMPSGLSFPEVIDSSMLAEFKACQARFEKSYISHWKPKEDSVHLHAGGAFARGLEVARTRFFVDEASAEDSIAEGLGALLKAYGDFQCPADSAKSAERTAGAFEFYFQHYPLTRDAGFPILLPGGKRAVEFSFAHPLPILHPESGNPLIWCGRMDAIISYAGGVFVCDEKTTSSLGATWSRQWDLRSQFSGYVWGAREAGIRCDGVIVRGVSILKTKYETQEALSYRPEWQVDRWYVETLEWINEMIQCWRTRRWRHNLDHSCAEYGGCKFRNVCTSQDERPWLETNFEQKIWNPITRESVPLITDSTKL